MTCFRLQLASAEHGAREEQHKQCLETSQELRYVRECERSTSKQYQVSGAGGTRMTAVVVSVDCLSILGGVKIITDACRSWQRNKSLGIAYLCSMSRLRLFVRRNAVSSARVDFTGSRLHATDSADVRYVARSEAFNENRETIVSIDQFTAVLKGVVDK